MAGCCSDHHCASEAKGLNSPQWRRALWIALAVNGGFFLAEIIAGLAAGSSALQADALDFLGDAANYAISLGVAGMALGVRARAALLKGGTLIVFALWVLGSTAWHASARHAAAGRSHGDRRRRRADRQWRRRADALPLPQRRREHALGVDLLAQRRHRQRRRGAGRAWRVRHRHRLAGYHRRRHHGRARPLGRRADRPAGAWASSAAFPSHYPTAYQP